MVAERAAYDRCERQKTRRAKTSPCQARAHYRVGVLLPPGPGRPNEEAVVFWLAQTVCADCRSALTFREVLPTKRWNAMRSYVKQHHGFLLRRAITKLAFQRL